MARARKFWMVLKYSAPFFAAPFFALIHSSVVIILDYFHSSSLKKKSPAAAFSLIPKLFNRGIFWKIHHHGHIGYLLMSLSFRGAVKDWRLSQSLTRSWAKRKAENFMFGVTNHVTNNRSAIYTMKFNPEGTIIASGSHD
ncbi:hypothetical protein LguiB_026996 [Lonicera macranthoides]